MERSSNGGEHHHRRSHRPLPLDFPSAETSDQCFGGIWIDVEAERWEKRGVGLVRGRRQQRKEVSSAVFAEC